MNSFSAITPSSMPPAGTPVLLRLNPDKLVSGSDEKATTGTHTVGVLVLPEPVAEPVKDEPAPQAQFWSCHLYLADDGACTVRRGAVIPTEALTGWMEIPA